MMEFLKRLFGKKKEQPNIIKENTDKNKIKRGSVIKDVHGKYHQVLKVMDGKVFFDDGYGWSSLESILAHCHTLPLDEVTLIEE